MNRQTQLGVVCNALLLGFLIVCGVAWVSRGLPAWLVVVYAVLVACSVFWLTVTVMGQSYDCGYDDGAMAERERRRLADAAVQVAHHEALGDRARYEGPSR